MSKKKKTKTINTTTTEKEDIIVNNAVEKTQAEVAKKYDVEVVKEPSLGEKISDGVDTALAWARRNWRKLTVAAIGVATAVALPVILDKRNIDDIPWQDLPLVEDEQEETVEEQSPEEEPAVEE